MKFKRYLLIFISLFCVICILSGCKLNNNNKGSITDAIKQVYGDKEYTISFNAQNLEKPIKALKFSVKEIPKLPVPEKLGYIFLGWFFDKDYLKPYDDSTLILGMSDVILYAKWQKEEFTQDGIYEIKYSAEVLKETILKEELVDKYGGIKDFTKKIVAKNTYIEKTGSELLLKIEYDQNALPAFGKPKAYDITLSQNNNDPHIYIKNTIDSLADSNKSIFLCLNNVDITKPIYLDIKSRDYESRVDDEIERNKMGSQYTIKFRITKFLGFDKAFVNTKNTLEDGNYLIRTYYQSASNEETMMSLFNPVYSYLTAKDGKYKLIKPIAPYYGMIGSDANLEKPLEKNFYKRYMTFTTINNFYDISMEKSRKKEKFNKASYFPSIYEGGSYGNLEMEYNSKANKFYYVFDLGTRLDRDFMFSMFVSGFMENNLKFGNLHGKMTLDYENMVKLAHIDYEPLSGESFNFRKEFIDYPGQASDLAHTGSSEIYLNKYGVKRDYYNFFYSLKNGYKKVHSHRITIKPNRIFNLAEARYQITSFTSNFEIFDYDGISNLYADKSSTSSFYNDNGIRNTSRVLLGKTYNLGEDIDLEALFKQLVANNIDFNNVSCYELQSLNGVIDINTKLAISKNFKYQNEKVILYTYIENSFRRSAVVRIKEKDAPVVDVNDKDGLTMDKDKLYDVGMTASLPFVRYKFKNGVFTNLYGKLYIEEETTKQGLNVSRVICLGEEGSRKTFKGVTPNTDKFLIYGKKLRLLFDIRNEFDEFFPYIYEYKITPKIKQQIINDQGDVYYDSVLRYNDTNEVMAVRYERSQMLDNQNKLFLEKNRKYYLRTNGVNQEFKLLSYTIYFEDKTEKVEIPESYNLDNIIDEIITKITNKSCVVKLGYQNSKNIFSLKFLLNATLSGHKDTQIMRHQAYFTETPYYIPNLELLNLDGKYIGNARISVYKYDNGSILAPNSGVYESVNTGSGLKLVFHSPGKYALKIDLDSTFGHSSFMQVFEVYDINSEITIKYKTDASHPFKDGTLEKEFKYNLLNPIISLDHNYFLTNNDQLIGFICGKNTFNRGQYIRDFIGTFNSRYVEFTAKWDPGARVVVKPNYPETGVKTNKYKLYGDFYGKYSYNFKAITPKTPDGYRLLGYKSSIFKGGFITINQAQDASFSFYGDITIELVYEKELTIKYEIDKTYSSNYLKNDKCYKGDFLPKRTLDKVKPEYEFIGWYVKGDPTEAIINYDTYKVENDITLVAKFRHK